MKLFPKVEADGSFVVRATFSAAIQEEISTFQSWLSKWMVQNSEWTFFGETHQYASYFRSAPELYLSSSGTVSFVFRGISDERRMWKDWMVRILKEFQDQFPQVGTIERMQNEDEF